MNVSKICKTSDKNDCFYQKKYLNGSESINNIINGTTGFYLSDGVLLFIRTSIEDYGRKYADVHIDINGSSKPNKMSKDIFVFRYEIYGSPAKMGKFLPPDFSSYTREAALNHSSYGCNKNAIGIYCSNIIMKDGWQIKDDYPW